MCKAGGEAGATAGHRRVPRPRRMPQTPEKLWLGLVPIWRYDRKFVRAGADLNRAFL